MVTLLLAFRLSPLLLLLLAGPAIVTAGDLDAAVPPDTEAAALLRLKATLSDPANALEAWSPSSPSAPCNDTHPWPRVQCYNGGLIGLRLSHLNLSGEFDFAALSRLPGLHSINLMRNNFSGPLPASLATVRSLRALYLSSNAFTGPVPGEVFHTMSWLKKLYLDNNDFSGVLPADAIAGAPRLLELHLDHNRIEGPVPSKLPATLRRFNVSYNHLSGVLPEAVAVRFNESAFAGNPGLCGAPGSDPGACAMAEFVLMSNVAGEFGLPELMKASAEVLGNGNLGSAYKAAMRNGVTVAVKRMRDMNRVGRVEFEEHLQMLGELRHPNVLSPVGYHYRKEEKLIVSEFMPRGSLLYVLHGDQSPERVVLDWPARLRIAVGVARGMAYLHEKLGIPAMRLIILVFVGSTVGF
uniref:Protein kinase domain-containing protein n=1 Tax=Oryza brachyantha TaxID=4533 RepID=J3N9M7_ORYBR